MLPLKTSRHVLTWFCVYPPDESCNKWKYVAFTAIALTIHLCSTTSDGIVFVAYISTDLEKSLMGLLQLFGNASMAYSIVTMLILQHKINHIFKSLTEIYEFRKQTKEKIVFFSGGKKVLNFSMFLA